MTVTLSLSVSPEYFLSFLTQKGFTGELINNQSGWNYDYYISWRDDKAYYETVDLIIELLKEDLITAFNRN